MRPVLSVALCTFNGCKYLKEQLLSIVGQELIVDEIVICDDGSDDETLTIVNAIANNYPNIQWIIERNIQSLGVTKNFEKALSLCSGDIIFLSDQDDVWKPYKTRIIVDYLEKHPEVDLVFSDAELIDGNGNLKTDKTLFDACGLNELREQWDLGMQFEIENVIQRLLGATFGMRREFVKRCLPFDSQISNYHDGQLAMTSVAQNCNGMIDEPLIEYRIHGNNVVGLGGNNNWVFSGNNRPYEFANLIEPRPVHPFFLSSKADKIRNRVSFYQKRFKGYSSIKGKVSLILSLSQYRKYYKKFWRYFFLSDVLYGFFNNLRTKIVNLPCKQR